MIFQNAFDPFRSLKATFAAMNLAPAQLWGGGLLIAFLDTCTQNSAPSDTSGGGPGFPEETIIMIVCVGCGLGLLAFLGACWVRPGVFLNLKSVLETGEADSKGIFDHRGLFVQVLLASLLKGVIVVGVTLLVMSPLIGAFLMPMSGGEELGGAVMIGGLAFFVLIGLPTLIYLTCGLALVGEIVIYERAQPMEALSRSWNMASGNRMQIFLYALVTGIFTFLGVLLCCVGVIATSAITTLAWGEAYLQLNGSAEVTDDQSAVEFAPDEDPDHSEERRIRLD